MRIKILLLFIWFVSFNCFSKDYYIENNGEIEVDISDSSLNKIKVFKDRIKDVRANYDELIIDVDKSSGDIYVKPVYTKEFIDIYLKTENGFSYKLVLKPKNIRSQQIFLNINDFILDKYSNSKFLREEKEKLIKDNQYFDFSEDYKISAINLIRVMSNLSSVDGFNIVERNYEELLSYKDFKVNWMFSYIKNDNSGISGEVAEIKNISNKTIEINETMFFKNGIRAIRLEKFKLEPKEIGYLFFVGGADEF